MTEQELKRFRYYVMTTAGTGVGICEREGPLRVGELVTVGSAQLRWRVVSTLGEVARVELDG